MGWIVGDANRRERSRIPVPNMVVRKDTARRHPGLTRTLFEVFSRAKQLALTALEIERAPKIMLPWPHANLIEARELMGEPYWPYGVAPNRRTLAAQLASWEQHLLPRPLDVEELFLEESLGPIES